MPKMEKKQQLEEFEMIFVDMGQGDCCIIKCPDGNVVMVDCGRSENLDEEDYAAAKQQLLAWANGGGIYAIIFTHPDRDHYNMTGDILSKANSTEYLKVDHVIFSAARSEKSPMGNYKENGVNNLIYGGFVGNPKLYEITINDTESYYKQWEQNSNYQESTKEYIEKSSVKEDIEGSNVKVDIVGSDVKGDIVGVNVIKGTTVSGKKEWSIDILAGNVLKVEGESVKNTNAASLVTLLRIGDEKVLLTGDSTVETQDFLYKTYKEADTIKNLSIFQIPHHGSKECKSKESFIKLVNPQQLVVSVGKRNHSFCLPRYVVLKAWIDTASRLADLDVKENVFMDWWKGYDEVAIDATLKKPDYILALWTKERYTYSPKEPKKSFYWLDNPLDAGTGFYGFKNTGFYLYNEQKQKQIWQTCDGNIESNI